MPALEKKYNDPSSLFRLHFGICVTQNQKTFEDQGLITEVKKYLHRSMIGKIMLHMGRIQANQRRRCW